VGAYWELESKKAAVRQRYGLPEQFFFYPAQFWLHKNHARLVHAIHILRATYQIDAPLVLAGSNSGGPPEEARDLVFENAMALARQLGIEDLVHYLGYVADDEMAPLYLQAAALAMPTFFGPTNIPVLEAWALGCPVLSSDIRGIREQVGDAGLLVDPRDPRAIAEGLLTVWTDEAERRRCIEAGHRRFASYSASDFSRRLIAAIESCDSGFRRVGLPTRSVQSEQLRGSQYFEQGHWEEALASFDRVATLGAHRQGLHYLRAQCYYRLGRWKDCERAIFAELKIQPNHPDARGLLRELRLQRKPVAV
jgi:tetratricopeptide (TPR) repeat protein